jgi:[protein-PII] uridylyltransferase
MSGIPSEPFRSGVDAASVAAWKRRAAGLRSPEWGDLGGLEAGRGLSAELDELLREIFASTFGGDAARRLALLATGGYGRRELCVQSDVDLCLLAPDELSPEEADAASCFQRALWDAGLEPGFAVRTLDDCLGAVGADLKTATSLIDARPIAGDAALAGRLRDALRASLRGERRAWFVEGRLARRRERREKHGGAERVLEPNLKEGMGGLRDLHDVLWIGWAFGAGEGLGEMAAAGFLSEAAAERARGGLDYLLRLRNRLHLLRGRQQDVLSVADRAALAPALGYESSRAMLAEEALARDTFLRLRDLAEISDDLLRRLLPAERGSGESRAVAPCYALSGGELRVDSARLAAWRDDPASIFGFFLAALETGAEPSPEARDLIRERLATEDLDAFRSDPRHRDAFLAILAARGQTTRLLRAMQSTGALAAYLPEWAKLEALARADGYHRYAVDEHTLQAIGEAESLLKLDDARSPIARLARELPRWEWLTLGLLLHDIGKGEGSAHAIKGAQIVRQVAARIGLGKADADVVHFLVGKHLVMNHAAQRRDPSDPAAIRDMANDVDHSPERLDLLCVLTRCDLAAVGPGVWNDWKEQLLVECWGRTRAWLEAGGAPAAPEEEEGVPVEYAAAVRAALVERGDAIPPDLDALLARLPSRYHRLLPPEAAASHALLLEERREDSDPVTWLLRTEPGGACSGLALCAPDAPGLFRLACHALASKKIDVLAARACAAEEGIVFDYFQIAWKGGALPESLSLERLRGRLNAVLRGDATEEEALGPLPPLAAVDPVREARAPTSATVSNEASDRYTVVEMKTSDRPGVLARACGALAEAGLFIHQAMIATEAYRVVDVFYVTDLDNEKLTDKKRSDALSRKAVEALRGSA